MTEETIRDREELSEQIRSLKQLIELGKLYGFDIARPAANTQEAIQWMYLAYLASVKDQNGAAMSIGRTSTFIDIYAERDLKNGTFTEEQIQEFVDHFIMKLRMVKFARTPEYQNLFSGDPQWVTESIGGMGVDGRTLVTKMSYRYLHTLENMGTSPEPNLTVLWSTHLPQAFKEFCAKTSIASSSIQYENDDVMRVYHGDDYAIACCVSSMRVGKEMQFFGARANLAKCLLYALNGGVDEVSKKQVGPKFRPVEGDFPKYGNDDDRVDVLAHDIVHQFMEYIRMNDTYRNSVPTTSVLTITSNVVYGQKTGATPDGRKAGVPFAPGANPMHQRDTHGAIASLSSVSKLPFRDAQDGISNTFSIIPGALGKEDQVMFGDLDLGDVSFENPVACCDCTDSSAPEGSEDR